MVSRQSLFQMEGLVLLDEVDLLEKDRDQLARQLSLILQTSQGYLSWLSFSIKSIHIQGTPFSFSSFREGCYPEKKHVRWILKDLLNHSRQWAEVLIWTEAVGFNQNLRLLPNEKGYLPLLKKLEIKSNPYFGGLRYIPHLPVFSKMRRF